MEVRAQSSPLLFALMSMGYRQELTEEIISRLHKVPRPTVPQLSSDTVFSLFLQLTGSEIEVHWISCTTREGIDEFIDALNSKVRAEGLECRVTGGWQVEETTMSEDEAPLITRGASSLSQLIALLFSSRLLPCPTCFSPSSSPSPSRQRDIVNCSPPALRL